jgi:hypothetical protein
LKRDGKSHDKEHDQFNYLFEVPTIFSAHFLVIEKNQPERRKKCYRECDDIDQFSLETSDEEIADDQGDQFRDV